MDAGGADQAFTKVVELASLCSLTMALKAAVELKVMDILAQHGGQEQEDQVLLSSTEIASHLGSPRPPPSASTSLDRILRLLASHGILSSSSSLNNDTTTPQAGGEPMQSRTLYGLNSISRFLVQADGLHQPSLSPYVLMIQDPIFMQSLNGLHEAVLHGSVPFVNAHGMKPFAYTQKDARFNHVLNRGMGSHTQLFTHSLLEAYNGFADVTSLVDVGGGIGAMLGEITSKYPHIKGINFDLPHVVANAPQYPGVEHVGGDMFEAIPKADAIFMKWILHDWSDEHCLRILENCYKALPSNGKVIVVDVVLPVEVEHGLNARVGYQKDILMLALTEGGRERNIRELENMSKASKFVTTQVIGTIHGVTIVEFYKN